MSEQYDSFSQENRPVGHSPASFAGHRFIWLLPVLVGVLLIIAGSFWLYQGKRSTPKLPTTREEVVAAAIAEFEKALDREPGLREAYAGLSKAYELKGDMRAVESVWRRALQTNPDQTWPYIGLAEFYSAQGMNSEARNALRQALAIEPVSVLQEWDADDLLAEALGVARVDPAAVVYGVGQMLRNGWMLLGYRTDEAKLARGESAELILFWRAPSNQHPDEEDGSWRAFDNDLWAQVLPSARSVIDNGDFEQGMIDGAPLGFSKSIYKEDPSVRQVRTMERNGELTQVGALANNEQNINASFVSNAFKVKQGQLYLQGGWIKAPQGNAFLGYRWIGSLPEGARAYAYVASKVQTEEWRHVVGVAKPLPGSRAAEIWLLNFKSAAPVAFDDVFFVPIGQPAD
ncbi:MAG: hypothetical protein GXP42_11850 [Chloroflexi bacterium]|nr:hypothetical protein [Chloroflexota bacterium]